MDNQSSKSLLSQSFFEELLVSFLTQEGASRKTQKNYLSDIRDFFSFLLTNGDMQEVTQSVLTGVTINDIDSYLSFLLSGRTSSTGVRHLSSLRTFFRALVQSGICKENPADEYYKNKQKQNKEALPSEIESTLLLSWEVERIKAGHIPHRVKTDVTHVRDFIIWIKRQHSL